MHCCASPLFLRWQTPWVQCRSFWQWRMVWKKRSDNILWKELQSFLLLYWLHLHFADSSCLSFSEYLPMDFVLQQVLSSWRLAMICCRHAIPIQSWKTRRSKLMQTIFQSRRSPFRCCVDRELLPMALSWWMMRVHGGWKLLLFPW